MKFTDLSTIELLYGALGIIGLGLLCSFAVIAFMLGELLKREKNLMSFCPHCQEEATGKHEQMFASAEVTPNEHPASLEHHVRETFRRQAEAEEKPASHQFKPNYQEFLRQALVHDEPSDTHTLSERLAEGHQRLKEAQSQTATLNSQS